MKTASDVNAYIALFPVDVQLKLKQLRQLIQKTAPAATEKISYGMPAYQLHGALVYFGAYTKHIGFYPTASGTKAFQKEIVAYKSSKGAIQFPTDQPLPLALIKKIVQFRVKENLQRAATKK